VNRVWEITTVNANQVIPGLTRGTDPYTSHLAGSKVNAHQLMEAIYTVMTPYSQHGCTSDEVEIMLPHILSHSITPRFKQMLDAGMIELTGQTKKARTGRQQLVRRVLPPPFYPRIAPQSATRRLHKAAPEILRQLTTMVLVFGGTTRLEFREDYKATVIAKARNLINQVTNPPLQD